MRMVRSAAWSARAGSHRWSCGVRRVAARRRSRASSRIARTWSSCRFRQCSRASPICARSSSRPAQLREAGRGTLLFIDEIHRFNRAQQDGFLPYVEDGTVILVGATTENPSFELNPPLLSRCRVLVLNRLDDAALEEILLRAERTIGRSLPLDPEARASLRAIADGDGRYLLNLVEVLSDLPAEPVLDTAGLAQLVQRRMPLYDKGQESHYNLISALHKSLRGSDTDAALYWFARMIAGGEDPNYIARRLVRFAVEDVGLADPQALVQALAAWQAYERMGSRRRANWRSCNASFISAARPSRTPPTGRHRPRTPPREKPAR